MSNKYYCAEYKIIDYQVSGWDQWTDIEYKTLKANSMDELKEIEEKFITKHCCKSYGDFGICLRDTKVKLIRKFISEETEINSL